MTSFKIEWKYDGNEASLPQREMPANTVPFKEPQNMKKLAIVLNVASIFVALITITVLFIRGGLFAFSYVGAILSMVCLIPHEFLHGICFKEDVTMYNNLKQGMLFVISLEDLSRGRFVFLSLLPNIVFGFIPYILFLIFPSLKILGTLGAISIAGGVGDYMNVYNCLTQVPKGGLTFLSGIHSYWYMPEEKKSGRRLTIS